jgi:hypothetical protein
MDPCIGRRKSDTHVRALALTYEIALRTDAGAADLEVRHPTVVGSMGSVLTVDIGLRWDGDTATWMSRFALAGVRWELP